MKLRDFLKTVPVLGAALAIPAKATPVMQSTSQNGASDARGGDYRGWWSESDESARTVTFTAVERCANGDRSHGTIVVNDSPWFSTEVREMEEIHSRWTARVGPHPFLVRHPVS